MISMHFFIDLKQIQNNMPEKFGSQSYMMPRNATIVFSIKELVNLTVTLGED